MRTTEKNSSMARCNTTSVMALQVVVFLCVFFLGGGGGRGFDSTHRHNVVCFFQILTAATNIIIC